MLESLYCCRCYFQYWTRSPFSAVSLVGLQQCVRPRAVQLSQVRTVNGPGVRRPRQCYCLVHISRCRPCVHTRFLLRKRLRFSAMAQEALETYQRHANFLLFLQCSQRISALPKFNKVQCVRCQITGIFCFESTLCSVVQHCTYR